MENPKEEKKSNQDIIKDIKSFLDNKFAPKSEDIKPEPMSDAEMGNFFSMKIMPVFKKLEKQLEEYKFDKVWAEPYRRVATLRVSETFSLFILKVDINNGGRQIVISYDLGYRTARKTKLIRIFNTERVFISFRDIDTINDNMILSLFAKWYMNKESEIDKFKEWKAKNENK